MAHRIVIVGAGTFGMDLGMRLQECGNSVHFAARNLTSEKVLASLAAVPDSTVVPLAEAAVDADVLIMAVPFAAVVETMRTVGDVGDAVVVDATNALGKSAPDGHTTVLDLIAEVNPAATLVKAFNTVGAEAARNPVIGSSPIFLPIAGDKDGAEVVRQLAADIGFDAMVLGGRDQVELVENYARFCVFMSIKGGIGSDFGFALLRR